MNRRIFLTASIVSLAGIALQNSLEAQSAPAAQNAELRAKADSAIEKGLGFLEKAQKPGGFWSTPDYPGLTGLIVQAFATAPGGKRRASKQVEDGLKFIRDSAKPDGGIYNKGMGNYNTSIALATLVRVGSADDQKLMEAARKYLIGAQSKNNASQTNDGGFGYEAGGSGGRSRPDLDNTVFAIEALAVHRDASKTTERPGQDDLNWKAAIDFISRCQNLPATNKEKWASDDPAEKGGFTYTPAGDEANTHSYGTMTYAGLLSLLHAEVKKDDPRVKAAVEWLSRHYTVDENPGKGKEGLYYYYLVMSKGLTAAGIDSLKKKDGSEVNWRDDLVKKILTLQKPDGSWANESGRWMEKDPVLVTGYVVLALNILRDRL
jgi:squalene-hopene/tetraprenyl-beta-curcumene cyclase